MTTRHDLEDQIETMRRRYLKANGWSYGMWRYYWVWRKQAPDVSFTCLSAQEALVAEGALQSSANYVGKKP